MIHPSHTTRWMPTSAPEWILCSSLRTMRVMNSATCQESARPACSREMEIVDESLECWMENHTTGNEKRRTVTPEESSLRETRTAMSIVLRTVKNTSMTRKESFQASHLLRGLGLKPYLPLRQNNRAWGSSIGALL